METLLELGHREIVYIGETNRERRYQGYCDALKKEGIPLKRTQIINAKQGLIGGYSGVINYLERKEPFTAIFCANDATAIGAIKALTEKRYKVPRDISVISIDDIELARYSAPMLTTIHVPIDELGRMAAKILIDRIENGHALPIKIELPFSLRMRDSCRRLGEVDKGNASS